MTRTTRKIATIEARYLETINPIASLGFIGLATDRASLPDFRAFIEPYEGVAIHSTRIPFAPVATADTLRAMEAHLRTGAELLVPDYPVSTISFSCTSGTIAIGADNVRSLIQSARPEAKVVTPIEAAITGLRALGARRISLLMPYLKNTACMVADHMESSGFDLDAVATFDLNGDPEMNRVDPASIFDEATRLVDPNSDALFISCTGWLTHPVIDRLEKELGKPVISSNQALAWQALRQAGVVSQVNGQGRLFSQL
ncbi:maleate cis-trans isomerase family protein [Labrys neptuniae]